MARRSGGRADRYGTHTGRTAPDGTWPYGDGAGLEWVDSFHTGYVLDSLCRLEGVDPRIPSAIDRGAHAYVSFFEPDGRPRLWRDGRYPEDSRSAGTGLTVLDAPGGPRLRPLGDVQHLAQYTSTA